MVEYRMEIDLDEVLEGLDKLERRSPEMLDHVVATLADAGMGYVQEHKLSGQVLKRRTGDLATKMRTQATRRGVHEVIAGGADVPYAAIHEFGGEIRPKRGRYLRFRTPDGAYHTVERVFIPARPYMSTGMNEFLDRKGGRIAEGAVDTWLRREWG